jgi:hypothetical protein
MSEIDKILGLPGENVHSFAPTFADPKPGEDSGNGGGGDGQGKKDLFEGRLDPDHPQAKAWREETLDQFKKKGNSGDPHPWGNYPKGK